MSKATSESLMNKQMTGGRPAHLESHCLSSLEANTSDECQEALRKTVKCHAQYQPDHYLTLVLLCDVLYFHCMPNVDTFALNKIMSLHRGGLLNDI
jgi:hypothetical protein